MIETSLLDKLAEDGKPIDEKIFSDVVEFEAIIVHFEDMIEHVDSLTQDFPCFLDVVGWTATYHGSDEVCLEKFTTPDRVLDIAERICDLAYVLAADEEHLKYGRKHFEKGRWPLGGGSRLVGALSSRRNGSVLSMSRGFA